MICFDTMVVIWGIQGVARSSQTPMVARTKRYVRFLSDQRTKIMIPAPVVTEYLVGFVAEDAELQRRLLEENFFVPSLDLPAAQLAADLLRSKNVVETIRAEHGITREQLRNDAQILAVAIANKAEKVISTDLHMNRLAAGRVPVVGVPDIENQLELFD